MITALLKVLGIILISFLPAAVISFYLTYDASNLEMMALTVSFVLFFAWLGGATTSYVFISDLRKKSRELQQIPLIFFLGAIAVPFLGVVKFGSELGAIFSK